MFQKKINKFVFDHPFLLQLAKGFLSNRLIANSGFYKYLVMKKAKHNAEINSEFKDTIFIETILDCNSRCVFCAHNHETMSGTMTMELFKKIIDECQEYGIKNVILGVYGEPILDRFFFKRIEYIRENDMTYGLITNASLLTSDKVKELFKMGGLTHVNFSVNGFSKEVYEKTMIGLKRDISYKNILYFLDQKNKLKIDDLIVSVSAVLTKMNRKDFKFFFKFWRKQRGVNDILPVEMINRMGNDYKGELGKLGPMTKKHNWLSPCRSIWGALMIYYDGKVATCCKDNDKRKLIVGDINLQTVREVSTSKALRELRQCHLSGKRKDHSICGKCYLNSVWFGQ